MNEELTPEPSDVEDGGENYDSPEIAGESPAAEGHDEEPRIFEAQLVGGPVDDPFALGALILGIVGLLADVGFLICCVFAFGPVLSLAAVVLGIISLKRIKTEPDKYKGEGFAWTGIALGAANVLIVLVLIVLGMFFGVAAGLLEQGRF